MNDHELASDIAKEAGRLLLSTREEVAGAADADVRAEGDRRAHEYIVSRLAAERPADAVLSEEAKDDSDRLNAARVWIVDPLDGTREFAEGRSDWAVHVALWEDGALTAGAVALPGDDLTLSTAAPLSVAPAHDGPPRLVVSRTRPPQITTAVVTALGGVLVPMGSAGAKAMAILRGQADIYVHAGGQYQWDSAAPVAVARHAGLHTSRIDGSELTYNGADPYLPDLVICRPELSDRVLETIAADGGAR